LVLHAAAHISILALSTDDTAGAPTHLSLLSVAIRLAPIARQWEPAWPSTRSTAVGHCKVLGKSPMAGLSSLLRSSHWRDVTCRKSLKEFEGRSLSRWPATKERLAPTQPRIPCRGTRRKRAYRRLLRGKNLAYGLRAWDFATQAWDHPLPSGPAPIADPPRRSLASLRSAAANEVKPELRSATYGLPI
jgi:hypothetical protein